MDINTTFIKLRFTNGHYNGSEYFRRAMHTCLILKINADAISAP